MRVTNISRWSVVAEVVSAVAVVLSLIYVGSEIRQNTISTQLSNAYSAVTLSSTSSQWLSDSEFAATYAVGLRDFSALDDTQRIQFEGFVSQKLNVWEIVFLSHEQGLIDDAAWGAWEGYFKSQIRSESWRSVWKDSQSDGFQGPFQVHVDTILASD